MVNDVVAEMLRKIGCDVTTAYNGNQAVDLLKTAIDSETPFDAAIVDLKSHGGLGLVQLLRKLRAIDPAVRAIISSGCWDDRLVAEYWKYGFCRRLLKPFNLHQLKSTLQCLWA